MPQPLTSRQREILEWLRARPYPPTVREIGAAFGIAAPNGVTCHLRALERKGFIVRDRRKSRGIRVLGREAELLEVLRSARRALEADVITAEGSLVARLDRQIERLEKQRH